MRLAVVETSRHGGLLHYAVQLADGLAARGHAVDLLAPREHELSGRTGPARMRSVLPSPIKGIEQPRGRVAYFARRAGIAQRLVRSWGRIGWESRRGGYDAVIVNSDLTVLPATVSAFALTLAPRRTAIVDVCHNVRVFNRWTGEALFQTDSPVARLLARTYPRFDLVLVHGEKSRAEFEQTWPPTRLAVVPHGDERVFGDSPPPPADQERILFFGDWRKVKGLFVLMEAFDLLAARRPSVRLTIAGTPAPADVDPAPIQAWAAGHDGRVEVIPRYVPVEEVPGIFGRARVVVTPYLAGYQSGVIHLAQTMARAVVSSDVGDLGAAVRHEAEGLLVPPGDVAALADALERLLSDPVRAQRLGAAGRERVLTTSSWETVAERVERALLAVPRLTRPQRPSRP